MADLQGSAVLNARELGLIALSDETNTVIGLTPTALTRPLNKTAIVLDSELGAFRVKLGDFSALGAELVTNGAFAADTDWTKGTGWTIAAGVADSDASQAGDSDLTQTLAAGTLDQGEYYEVTFTIANRTAGNVTPIIGGTEGTDRSTNATFTEVIQAGSTQVIGLRADVSWDGDVDDFTVKVAKLQSTDPAITTTGGGASIKLRVDRPIALSAPSVVTVVGDDAANILTYYWV